MTEPTLISKEELAQIRDSLKRADDRIHELEREVKLVKDERDQALTKANNAKLEAERLRKALPSEKVAQENKGLRDAVADGHRKISDLQKELQKAAVELDTQKRENAKLARRFDGVQATFDTMQEQRKEAYTARDKALAKVQEGADAYAKLQAEFDAYRKEVAPELAAARAAKKPQPQPVAARA